MKRTTPSSGRPPPNRRSVPPPPPPSWEDRWARLQMVWGRVRDRAVQVWVRIRRPMRIAGKVALAVALVAGMAGVGRLVERHLHTAPAFDAQTIAVEGNDRLGDAQVRHAAGLAIGQNVFEVGPRQAQQQLEARPWIAEARVRRRLPDEFHIRIREHRAAALLAVDGGLYLVSRNGTVFKELGPDDPADLPVVTGIERRRFVRDRPWRTSLLLEVIALLQDYRTTELRRRAAISEVHVEPDGGLSLYVGDKATRIRLGEPPYRDKLDKLRTVLQRLDRRDATPAYVYLDDTRQTDRVTVKVR